MLKAKIFTIFPEMFPGPLGYSLAGKAKGELWDLETINIRDYADKYAIDDSPFGGGAGMVMRPDILGKAIDANVKKGDEIIYLSPRGKIFNQKKAYELANKKNLAIIAGRFEGIDQRVIDEYNIQEISIGDFILSGGEIACLLLLDSCIRLLPGVIGNEDAIKEESFGQGRYSNLLEYPLYTRPKTWKNREVPETLLSGNHKMIDDWRFERAKDITKQRRLDLWKKFEVDDE